MTDYYTPFGEWNIGNGIIINFSKQRCWEPTGAGYSFQNRSGMLLFALILAHYVKPDATLTKDEIDLLLWGNEDCLDIESRRNTTIKEARKQIGDTQREKDMMIIRNTYGKGYFIEEEPHLVGCDKENTRHIIEEQVDIKLIHGLLAIAENRRR